MTACGWSWLLPCIARLRPLALLLTSLTTGFRHILFQAPSTSARLCARECYLVEGHSLRMAR